MNVLDKVIRTSLHYGFEVRIPLPMIMSYDLKETYSEYKPSMAIAVYKYVGIDMEDNQLYVYELEGVEIA